MIEANLVISGTNIEENVQQVCHAFSILVDKLNPIACKYVEYF
jgi:hypothetical protein